MKNTLLISLFSLICFNLMASFPVNKKVADEVTVDINNLEETDTKMVANLEIEADEALSPAAASDSETKWVAVGLWFFLGGLAAHRWYRKKPVGWNILFILTLGGLGIWWLVDGINILTDNFD